MAWFKKTKDLKTDKKVKIPEGLWVKCDGCKEIVYKKEIEKNLKICPKCNYHFRISAQERLKLLVDEGSFAEIAMVKILDQNRYSNSRPYRRGRALNRKPPGENSALYFLSVRFRPQAVTAQASPLRPARASSSETGSREVVL